MYEPQQGGTRKATDDHARATCQDEVATLPTELAELQAELRDFRRHMDDRLDRLYELMTIQIRWTVGAVVVFGTLVSILVVLTEFTR
jgi:hypothetical protein